MDGYDAHQTFQDEMGNVLEHTTFRSLKLIRERSGNPFYYFSYMVVQNSNDAHQTDQDKVGNVREPTTGC
jgi:hypothetical protein